MKTEGYKLTEVGGKDKLILSEIEVNNPAPKEVQIEHESIGINFIDVYQRTGLYPLKLPIVLGMEGIGRITKVGEEVSDYRVGDLVGYGFGAIGAYQKVRNIATTVIFLIPEEIKEKVAGSLLRGLTCEYLINRIGSNLNQNDIVLFHAAAGGVGLIALQWLKHLGVKVIATAGNKEKRDIVEKYQADLILDYRDENFVKKVKDFVTSETKEETEKQSGVKIVYDSIGKTTFANSIDCLNPRGLFVSFGNASGPVEPFSPLLLSQKGSLFITRPTLGHYYSNQKEVTEFAPKYLNLIQQGVIQNEYSTSFEFSEIPEAHDFMEKQKSIGHTWVKAK